MKAILILDIDEKLELNELKPEEILFYWNGYPLGMKINKCVLKPMPQLEDAEDLTDMYDVAFASGWNSCISDMLDKSEYELMVKEKIAGEVK